MKIDIQKILEVKNAVSQVMEKKAELEFQMDDFKESISAIKSKKEKIKYMMNNSSSKRPNKIKMRVLEKRKF